MQDSAQQLALFIERHPRLFILTGAGISTDSGIPAYRDEKGTWQSPPPIQHRDYIERLAVRQRYWARSLVGWGTMRNAQPNSAHQSVFALERAGLVELIVTQNVDRLHQKAGSTAVVDLHGRADIVDCIECDYETTRDQMHLACKAINPNFNPAKTAQPRPDGDANLEGDFSNFSVPNCPNCGAVLKARVVYFGDNVQKEVIHDALSALERSQAMLCIGTSLQVFSGYRFNRHAKAQGIPQAALTQGITRADDILDLKLDAAIAPTLSQALEVLGIN